MADHADDNLLDGDIFVYRGGRAPLHITHARIDRSVDEIEEGAFNCCESLVQVDTHDGIRKIGRSAFWECISLRQINLNSAFEIEAWAFNNCKHLESVEFGDRLETIGECAFSGCTSLQSSLKLSSIITIRMGAFNRCARLTDVELSERLETIGVLAFKHCHRLQRIAIPLKRDLFVFDNHWQKYNQFDECEQLVKVDLVGLAHTQTVASLHMEIWRTEMNVEINRINQVLPTTPPDDKTEEIRRWIHSIIDKMDHYKAEHGRYVREGVTLLELALWKAKLDEVQEDNCEAEGRTKKARVDAESARKDKRMICGADMVINNVLPFLQLE